MTIIERESNLSKTFDFGKLEIDDYETGWSIDLDQEVIPEGSMVGDLHFNVLPRQADNWRRIPPSDRPIVAATIILRDLVSFAERSMSGDLAYIDVFHATSNLVKPGFVKSLGFTVRKPEEEREQMIREGVKRDEVDEIYGEGNSVVVGAVHEFWATRQQMIDALPKLKTKLERVLRRPLAA